jgi:ACS family hexuronate transporter-like MFS transporter
MSLETAGGTLGRDAQAAIGRQRWIVCALLFFATTINYMDRQVIGLLKPVLQSQLGWSEVGYGNIVLAFQLAYAIGLLTMGRLMDWLGTRRGFSLAVAVWSAAAMAHAAARTAVQFAAARFALGLGESGNFPASVKTVAEWFPKRERALATGLFNSGANIGAILTPLFIPWLTYRFGWQMAFIVTGALGLLWLAAWLVFYRRPEEPGRVSAAELAYIRSDPAEPETAKLPLRRMITLRQAWAIALGRFFTDPIWYVYLFWVPDFLSRTYQVDLRAMALPLFVIYTGASLGSIAGGWLSSALLRKGWSLNRSRKAALLVCALAAVPVVLAAFAHSLWISALLVALAAGAHQGWSANMYTLASDMFPRNAVGSVVGFGSMVGSIGGMFAAEAVGFILQLTGSYVPVFVVAGSAYLVAFVLVQALAPTMEMVDVS